MSKRSVGPRTLTAENAENAEEKKGGDGIGIPRGGLDGRLHELVEE